MERDSTFENRHSASQRVQKKTVNPAFGTDNPDSYHILFLHFGQFTFSFPYPRGYGEALL